jgi:DNA-binding NarL/FixJ family response regulator
MTISIVVAQDYPIERRGIRTVFEEAKDLSVVGEASTGLDAVRLAERFQPDVVVLDLLMPELNGIDALPILALRSPGSRIVIFTRMEDERLVLQALKGGAIAYVLKCCETSDLVKAVREAVAGRRFLCPSLWDRAVESYFEKARSVPEEPHETLTPREREVLQLAAEGHTAAEIARRLSISARTVEMHRRNMMHKLGLQTQTDLIRYALQRNIIPLH